MNCNHTNRKRRLFASVLSVALLLCSLTGCKQQTAPETEQNNVPKISYATEGITAVEDEDALQKAVDEMYRKAAEGNIALEYKNFASSTDGTNFSCYIANSNSNSYDMFITIFSDAELTDQLFLSGLIRPGQAFNELAVSHPLEPGRHTVYVVYTQVEEDLATIHAQVIVTCEFSVTG